MRWLATLLICLPSLAQALSCLPWGVTDAYLEADAAPETYVPVLGTLRFDESALPMNRLKSQRDLPKGADIRASFEGHVLTKDGTGQQLDTPVTLEVTCVAHWCGGATPGPVLAFLRKDADTYSVRLSACGGDLFGPPSEQQIEQVQQCLRGGPCARSVERG